MDFELEFPLGRRTPKNLSHVDKFPMRALDIPTIETVEKELILFIFLYSK